jgi:hypothetical protein
MSHYKSKAIEDTARISFAPKVSHIRILEQLLTFSILPTVVYKNVSICKSISLYSQKR